MTTEPSTNVTQILQEVAAGDRQQLGVLLGAVYDDLRLLAGRHMNRERSDHTLQATALVHEAYMRLIDQRVVEWNDRAHFFAVASRIIRRILVDHARARGSVKRGGACQRLSLEQIGVVSSPADVDMVALDDALERLAEIDEPQARIVELRFFGGLSVEEIAEVLEMGKRSVDREWSCAKAWLFHALGDAETPPESGVTPGGDGPDE